VEIEEMKNSKREGKKKNPHIYILFFLSHLWSGYMQSAGKIPAS
jgi:hypothetical protein